MTHSALCVVRCPLGDRYLAVGNLSSPGLTVGYSETEIDPYPTLVGT